VNVESTSSEMSSGQTISVERTDIVISPGQSASPLTESPTSETYQPETQADASPMPPVQQEDTARVIRPGIRNLRHMQHGRLRLGVKSRLIVLWHESLARSQHPRGWVAPWFLK
jgi:hypothetical protein